MVNTELLNAQSSFLNDMHHIIQVVSYVGHDGYGKRQLSTDPAKTRQYNCLIQPNENTAWTVESDTDALPYVAYIISTPIGQTDAYPIRVEEQLTVVKPDYLAGVMQRMGSIRTYPDQYGNVFVQVITFQ